jgi:hypothetical protein
LLVYIFINIKISWIDYGRNEEDEEEDVRSYWMTLRAGEDALI